MSFPKGDYVRTSFSASDALGAPAGVTNLTFSAEIAHPYGCTKGVGEDASQ